MKISTKVIERAQQGDREAFEQILKTYRSRIFGMIYRLSSRAEDAEDVAQEVFVRLYSSLGQLRDPEVFETWLYRLTMNAVYDHLRRHRRSADIRMADLSEDQEREVEDAVCARWHGANRRSNDARETLAALFEHLSPEDRLLLTQKEMQGLSLREMGKIYELNENALKVRLFRARKRALRVHQTLKKRQNTLRMLPSAASREAWMSRALQPSLQVV